MGLDSTLTVKDWQIITRLAEKLRIAASNAEGSNIAPGHIDRHPWAALPNDRKKKWLEMAKTAHEFYMEI